METKRKAIYIKFGNRNSKYFQIIVKIRSFLNNISFYKNLHRETFTNQNDFSWKITRELGLRYLIPTNIHIVDHDLDIIDSRISLEENSLLCTPILKSEVKRTIFYMAKDKIPGR